MSDDDRAHASVTFNMNILQGLRSRHTFCVTLNDESRIDPARVLRRFEYHHPCSRRAARRRRRPVAQAIIEAKAENVPPNHGLEQAKSYARCKRLNVPFAFSGNSHLFVEFDRLTGLTSPRPPGENGAWSN